MLHSLGNQLGDATLDRLTLLINHVLAAEPAASHRLAGHVGRTLEWRLSGLPAPLPAFAPTRFGITPAGLLERLDVAGTDAADLQITVDASNPALAAAQALMGVRPRIEIAGDAALAADLNWLFANLRWDVEDDLARVVGPIPAREITRIGGAIAAGLRGAARTVGGLAARR